MSREAHTLQTESVEETQELAEKFTDILRPGDIVALTGTLGAGKTCFVKGLGRGLGVDPDEVTSVSFLLMKEHAGEMPLYHFDAYRLEGADELEAIGCREAFEGRGVCAIEWADHVSECLPEEHFSVHMEVTGETSRRLAVEGSGPETRERLSSAADMLDPWMAGDEDSQ
ncbi:MAG: tRNA (adenosine(37)-N6)-threonylcarbamoyltransferase complex ATPase subunit type 1 TsaE [Planctomycetota bacterium]